MGKVSGLGYLLLCLKGQQHQESGRLAYKGEGGGFGAPPVGCEALPSFTHSIRSFSPSSPGRSGLLFMLCKEEAEARRG